MGPLWMRYIFPSEPRTRSPCLPVSITVPGCSSDPQPGPTGISGVLDVFLPLTFEMPSQDVVLRGACVVAPKSSFNKLDSRSSGLEVVSRWISLLSTILPVGFSGTWTSRLIIVVSTGFFGEGLPGLCLSVVMFSSRRLDVESGFPSRLPVVSVGNVLEGLPSFLDKMFGSTRSVSSSTSNTSPRPTKPGRLDPVGRVPSPRIIPRLRRPY